MIAFDQLTHLGRLRRIRQVAQAALNAFGIEGRFKLLRQAGNSLYRVYAAPGESTSSLFKPGQFLLRVHEPGYQTTAALELELAWLSAMRREADLPVPEPLQAQDGAFLAEVRLPGVPGTRHCSLLRWIKGRSVLKRMQPDHFFAQGRLMARLHTFSAGWSPASSLVKRHFDWDGLFQNDVSSGMPNAEAWALLPPEHHKAFSTAAEQVREVMNDWGQRREVFGLIHGDLAMDANLLFWHKEPVAIDFDDSGFGYWIYDLAVALEHCWESENFPRYRDALLGGYTDVRNLPNEQVAKLELFMAACEVYWNLWAVGGTHLVPQFLPEYQKRIERTANLVVRFAREYN